MLKLQGKHALGKKDVRQIQHLIQDVIDAASLKTAHFETLDKGQINKMVTLDTTKDVTPFIRDKVQLHHDSWIIEPLTLLLEELKAYE